MTVLSNLSTTVPNAIFIDVASTSSESQMPQNMFGNQENVARSTTDASLTDDGIEL